MPEISKRKLESYKRAEAVAQAARRFLYVRHERPDELDELLDQVLHWMKVTGNVKYEKPKAPTKRWI